MKTILRLLGLGLAALSLVFLTNCAQSSDVANNATTPEAQTVAANSSNYSEQVLAGIQYFQKEAQEQLPLAEKLLEALKSGDIEAAKTAYVNSRPPYEQIEVLAGNFEQEDTDIDARPYAFDGGAQDEAFKGFHRIEALVYREGNLKAAVPYGEGLIASINSLIDKLNDPSNFNAKDHFGGMIAVATEVPAKKISSEEETWSDQSLLIFKNNWIGINSQYAPFAALVREKDASIAQEVESAYQACLKSVEPFFTEGQVAAKPYSTVNAKQRDAIVDAAYNYVNALTKARDSLAIEA
ncbi:putative periplasmic lipoprotein involved in iron transport [Rivularia sp. PCC 7116]|uniref:EfeM/EfeO family lipoprotein n=1 Tax=Rivularia sp. PCC 7116 TaxID=373994 RepID=UPI00029F44B4|nr:EfeM/EfeO family lipoprotein [Rivularia sp. PCC 7116]AFY57261.1 putative periplasmic lipoprotein involved in iron transport [Rivularia sp. PCC 7116]